MRCMALLVMRGASTDAAKCVLCKDKIQYNNPSLTALLICIGSVYNVTNQMLLLLLSTVPW